MDQELKTKWITALRSGDYRQSSGRLRRHDGYCCLGVLCDVSGVGRWTDTGSGFERYKVDEMTYGVDLGTHLRLRFEVSVDDQRELVAMNDDFRADFTEIAGWIEENL